MADRRTENVRTIARSIVQRLVQDPGFAEELRTSPRAAVLAAGLPEWAVDDFLAHDLGLAPDVSGYLLGECAVTSLLGWSDEDGITAN